MSSTPSILGMFPIVGMDYYGSTRAVGTFTLASFPPKIEIPPACLSPGLGIPMEQAYACE